MPHKEGSLEAPTRHPLDWRSEAFHDPAQIDQRDGRDSQIIRHIAAKLLNRNGSGWRRTNPRPSAYGRATLGPVVAAGIPIIRRPRRPRRPDPPRNGDMRALPAPVRRRVRSSRRCRASSPTPSGPCKRNRLCPPGPGSSLATSRLSVGHRGLPPGRVRGCPRCGQICRSQSACASAPDVGPREPLDSTRHTATGAEAVASRKQRKSGLALAVRPPQSSQCAIQG